MKTRYYLIAQWRPDLGQTEENPGCLFTGSIAISWPVTVRIKPNWCYTSASQAERYADKNRRLSSLAYRYAVIDVTDAVRAMNRGVC